MKQTIYLSDFREAFKTMNRTENFSHEGLEILFDYLEQYEEDTGTEIELDVIALCCEFAEDAVEDIAENYGVGLSDCEADEERVEAVREYLNENTALCGEFEDADGVTRFVYARF